MIHYACAGGKLEIVSILLEFKKEAVNVLDSHQQSPIYSGIIVCSLFLNLPVLKYQKYPVLEFLVEKMGANVNIQDENG